MKLPRVAREAGLTLPEVTIGAAITSMVFAALVMGSIALQRTYAAIDNFGTALSDQTAALDYMTCDIRRAQSVAVTASPATITLTVQTYLDPTTQTPRTAVVSSGAVSYGGTTTITYSLSGSSLVRDQGGTRLIIARNVTGFTPVLDAADVKQKTVCVTLTFAAPLKWGGDPATAAPLSLTAKVSSRN